MSLWASLLLAVLLPAQQDPALLFKRGLALKDAGRNKEALAAFDAVLRLTPDDEEAYNNRGAVKFLLRDFQGAQADYSRAIALEGLDPKPLSNRCLLAVVEDRAPEGLLDCARSTQCAEDYFPGWNNLGYAFFEMGKFQQAQETWEKASEMSPESPEPVLGRALAALRLGNRRYSPALLKDAVALKPVIAKGPEAYEEAEGPFFGSNARAAYKELLRIFPPKIPKKKAK